MKFLFIVQGEGRGHMTQAIAFSNLITSQGHELKGLILGKSKRRSVPEFFTKSFPIKIKLVDSPNFETDKAEKKILLGKTILQNLRNFPVYKKSLNEINRLVKETEPDVILNFYDLLGGLYNGFFSHKAEYWVIGHQYLIAHPSFSFAPSNGLNKFFFKLNTRLTALGASKKFALSFYPLESTSKITVVPPLLREEVKKLNPTQGDFFLTYMVNSGYGQEVLAYAKSNPTLQIRAYWDKKDAAEIERPLTNLSFHQVHDTNFLRDMAACKGLVSTAGFESICEALYLGKPVMVIPVHGQYEQACNALDIEKTAAGLASERFDFGKFANSIAFLNGNSEAFKDWEKNWSVILPTIIQPSTPNLRNPQPQPLLLKFGLNISQS